MSDFKRLLVWQKAHALAVNVHRLAETMRHARYSSLRAQMVRAAGSVPANIVEGSRQASRREFGRFLGYALNSSSELEYHLILSRDIAASSEEQTTMLLDDVTEVRKMLYGLIRRVSRSTKPDRVPKPPTRRSKPDT